MCTQSRYEHIRRHAYIRCLLICVLYTQSVHTYIQTRDCKHTFTQTHIVHTLSVYTRTLHTKLAYTHTDTRSNTNTHFHTNTQSLLTRALYTYMHTQHTHTVTEDTPYRASNLIHRHSNVDLDAIHMTLSHLHVSASDSDLDNESAGNPYDSTDTFETSCTASKDTRNNSGACLPTEDTEEDEVYVQSSTSRARRDINADVNDASNDTQTDRQSLFDQNIYNTRIGVATDGEREDEYDEDNAELWLLKQDLAAMSKLYPAEDVEVTFGEWHGSE